jgi:hypothetical protein
MNWLLVVVSVVAVVVVVTWFLTTRHQPEDASSGPDDRRNVDAVGRGTQSPRNVDRPAGAGVPQRRVGTADPTTLGG